MNKNLYLKFLKNQCTEEELEQVVQWIKDDALNEDSKSWALDNWESFQDNTNLDDEVFSNVFDKIQSKIDNEPLMINIRKARTRVVISWLSNAAAVLFLPVLVILALNITKNRNLSNQITGFEVDSIEIIAPVGSRSVVELSDGSKVHLNYGSKLKYPQAFSGSVRKVKLSGEGFFEVSHNPDIPFIVDVGGVEVKAIGTSFNVKAYPEDKNIQTTLVEGKVNIEKQLLQGQRNIIGTMQPGQHVKYNLKSGSVKTFNGNINQYISWKDGVLVFEDTPIKEITKVLSRKYNVDISLDEEIDDYYYTVTFTDEHLYQILDLMAIATPVNYKILPRKKLKDGTYSKQKITITKNN